jgi:hypothetical protein
MPDCDIKYLPVRPELVEGFRANCNTGLVGEDRTNIGHPTPTAIRQIFKIKNYFFLSGVFIV